MKKIISILLFLVIFTSCKKDNSIIPEIPKTTKDLVVSSDFDWKTSKDITLNILGLKDVSSSIINTLYVKSSDNTVIYYKDQFIMKNDYVISFSTPKTETKINLIYGSKKKTIDLISNIVVFDYITE